MLNPYGVVYLSENRCKYCSAGILPAYWTLGSKMLLLQILFLKNWDAPQYLSVKGKADR